MKVLILNTKKGEFSRSDTGEVVSFCTSTIGHLAEDTENFSGYVIEEITGKSSDFDIIKKYVNKIVEVDFEYKKVDRKNYRQKMIKIADVVL